MLGAGDPRQLGQARVAGLGIEAIAILPRDGRHARAEATDDDGRRGIAAQITVRPLESIVRTGEAGGVSRPKATKDLRRLGDALGANGVRLHGKAQSFLLSRIRGARAAARAQTQNESTPGDLLEGGRHVGEEPRMPVGDVEHEGAEGYASRRLGESSQRGEALRHASRIPVGIPQVIPGP